METAEFARSERVWLLAMFACVCVSVRRDVTPVHHPDPVCCLSSFYIFLISQFLSSFINLAYIGGGTFGQVLGGVDTVTGENVAIKKLTRAFATTEDAKRAYREVKLLRLLCADGQGEDILQLKFLYRCAVAAYLICFPL